MTTPDTTAPALPAPDAEHQAQPSADLKSLEREAAALDGAPAAAESAQARAVAVQSIDSNRAQLHAVLVMVRKAALPLIALRSERKAAILSAIWTDDAITGIADSGAQVLALHGVKLGNLVAGFGPYVGLAMSLGPCAFGTYMVLKSPDPEPVEEVSGGQQQQA